MEVVNSVHVLGSFSILLSIQGLGGSLRVLVALNEQASTPRCYSLVNLFNHMLGLRLIKIRSPAVKWLPGKITKMISKVLRVEGFTTPKYRSYLASLRRNVGPTPASFPNLFCIFLLAHFHSTNTKNGRSIIHTSAAGKSYSINKCCFRSSQG